jgi:hypothetical protein
VANEEPIGDDQLRSVAERAKLAIYATARPIGRLLHDVEDISRFDGPGILTPQLRLALASPPLLPASAEILDAASRVYGWGLFNDPFRLLLDSMALLGPIAAAESFIFLMNDSNLTAELLEIGDAFGSVFERHRGFFLARTRATLGSYRNGLKQCR